jgi:hypothetical protein
MARELSELLAELSAESKKIEDAFATMAEETDARVAERRDQSRANAQAAVDGLAQGLTAVEASVAGNWQGLQDRMGAEVREIQLGIATRQHERDVQRATQQADDAEDRASKAVAFAAAALQTAGLAVFDAAAARRDLHAVQRG